MDVFEKRIQEACDKLEIPGAILVASTADGKLRYEKAFGVRSLEKPSPLTLDSTVWFASCTKLMTTVAALQCVERGQFTLDEDVTRILPELKDRKILNGFEKDSGKPILSSNTKPITLRHLLTHQSGFGYDTLDPALMQYRKTQNRTVGWKDSFANRTVTEGSDSPILFAPGESWQYGTGVDLAGEMAARVNNVTLEEYMETYIWGPLKMTEMTFHLSNKSSVEQKLADMSLRDAGVTMFGTTDNVDAKVKYTDETVWSHETLHCHGGIGCYGSVIQYQHLLHSICSDDGKLLNTSTINQMFQNHLTPEAQATFNAARQVPELNNIFGGDPPEVTCGHGFGGLLNETSFPGRGANTLSWGGLPNLLWFIDRNSGVSGIIATQIIPPGDPKVGELFRAWKVQLYKVAGIEL